MNQWLKRLGSVVVPVALAWFALSGTPRSPLPQFAAIAVAQPAPTLIPTPRVRIFSLAEAKVVAKAQGITMGGCRKDVDPSFCQPHSEVLMGKCPEGTWYSPIPCPTATPTPTPTPSPTAIPTPTPTPSATPIPWTTGVLLAEQLWPWTEAMKGTYYQQPRTTSNWHLTFNGGHPSSTGESLIAIDYNVDPPTYQTLYCADPARYGDWESGGARVGRDRYGQLVVWYCATWQPATAANMHDWHPCPVARLSLQSWDRPASTLPAPQRDLTWETAISWPLGVVTLGRRYIYAVYGRAGEADRITRYVLDAGDNPILDPSFGIITPPVGFSDIGVADDGSLLALAWDWFTQVEGTYYRSTDEGRTWVEAGHIPCPAGYGCWDWHWQTDERGRISWWDRPVLVTMGCMVQPGTLDWQSGKWLACYAKQPGAWMPSGWGKQPVARWPDQEAKSAPAVTAAQAQAAAGVHAAPTPRPFTGPIAGPRRK